jgi:outer membrane protein TolC
MNRTSPRTFALLLLVSAAASGASAQTASLQTATGTSLQVMKLTIDEAVRLATERSEALEAAKAGEDRATATKARADSQKRPQLNFTGTYTRTLASEFSRAFEAPAGPVCSPFSVDATKPVADRVAEIERAASCGSLVGSAFNFADLPFGQKNAYQLGFSFAQPLYTGGRLEALGRQAGVSERLAALVTSTTQAQLALDVARAYYDAALAERLLVIAESVYAQADASYEQTRLAFDAGRQPEFELLRAQVTRDNQRPTVIRRRADRDVALLRLRQLLELPAGTALVLDVDLERPDLPPPAPFATALSSARSASPDTFLSLKQADAAVELRDSALAIARADRRPTVSLSSSLAGVGYPSSGVVPSFGDFRANWSLSAVVQMPILTGGRIAADERVATADLIEARAVQKQSRELAELGIATALQDLTAAEAVWTASAGTVEQAERAYAIAELRHREGLSTQLELSDARLALEIARANRAQAGHDVQLARTRVALMPTLPVGAR